MISTDRQIFRRGSPVFLRQVEYARQWDEVHIVVFSKRGGLDEGVAEMERVGVMSLSPNCRAYPTASRFKLGYPLDAIRIGRKIIEGRNITAITCQDASLTALVGVSLKKNFGLPLEIQIHEDFGSPYYSFDWIHKIRKFLAIKNIPQTDRLRVVSRRIADWAQIYYSGQDPIEVRPITVDIEWIKTAPITIDLHKKYPHFKKVVLMASRLEKEKNISLAIRAWPLVREAIPEAGLLIVGGGSLKKDLKAQVAVTGQTDSIVFEDWAERGTLASYYRTADLFLNTSLFEGYGLTLVEARAADCPIVSTDVGVAREMGAEIVSFEIKDLALKIITKLKESNK